MNVSDYLLEHNEGGDKGANTTVLSSPLGKRIDTTNRIFRETRDRR
jgi:hypothetical protein